MTPSGWKYSRTRVPHGESAALGTTSNNTAGSITDGENATDYENELRLIDEGQERADVPWRTVVEFFAIHPAIHGETTPIRLRVLRPALRVRLLRSQWLLSE
jgi:hypothetical protein